MREESEGCPSITCLHFTCQPLARTCCSNPPSPNMIKIFKNESCLGMLPQVGGSAHRSSLN
ncbi:hypothetical protein E2C01_054649 [Portunus trituberculatus]|uniref:Uncharacterized protein n=1 Tax=Portunus trituberculatus TaxID=210409 RepID=A0A5B7GTS7_PORTR|nr:hypothetical protein [Portunus trituberculatus]